MAETRKSSLSPARQKLVDVMSEIRFGRIRSLFIQDGEPSFGPQTTVLPEIRFDSEQPAAAKPSSGDFDIRRQVVALFEAFDRIDTGRIDFLEIRHGLPWRMRFER